MGLIFLSFFLSPFQSVMYRPVSPLQVDSEEDLGPEDCAFQRTCHLEENQTLITDYFPIVENYRKTVHCIGFSFRPFVPGVKKLVFAPTKSNN